MVYRGSFVKDDATVSRAMFVWFMGTLFYSYQFFLRSSPGVMGPELMRDFAISAQALGTLGAAYYFCYSPLQIPMGILLDHFGPRKMLLTGIGFCMVGNLLFGLSHTYWLAVLARCLIGAGASVSFIGIIRLSTLWFSSHHLAFMIGLTSALGKISGFSAMNLLMVFIALFVSWHGAILSLSFVGLFIFLMLYLFVRDRPKGEFVPAAKHLDFRAVFSEMKVVLSSRTVWLVGFFGSMMYVALSVLSEIWAGQFIGLLHGIPKEQAYKMTSLLMLGSCIGAPAIAYCSDFFRKRIVFMRFTALCTFILFATLLFVKTSSILITCGVLFGIGFFSAGQILGFAVATESAPSKLAGAVSGVVNMFVMTGGAFQNPLVGWLLDFLWSADHPGVTQIVGRVYSVQNYQTALLPVCIGFLVAFIITFFLPETFPEDRKD